MNKLQVELVKLQKAVERKARNLHKDVTLVTVSIDMRSYPFDSVDFVHVHTLCELVTYRINGAASVKQVLQQMTEENSF